MRTVLALAVVAGLLVVGWLNRDQLERAWRSARVEVDAPARDSTVSPATAKRAQEKLTALETGDRDRIALGEGELQSLLQYRYSQLIRLFADTPQITLEDTVIRVRARLPADRLSRINELGQIAALLPDTTEIAVTGTFIPIDEDRVALAVEQVSAADIPLPRGMTPTLLEQLGRKEQHGVPENAVGLPLPAGARGAYIERDSLVLVARPIRRPANGERQSRPTSAKGMGRAELGTN